MTPQQLDFLSRSHCHSTPQVQDNSLRDHASRNIVRSVTQCSLHWMTQALSVIRLGPKTSRAVINQCRECGKCKVGSNSRYTPTHLFDLRGDWSALEAPLDPLRRIQTKIYTSSLSQLGIRTTGKSHRPSFQVNALQLDHCPIQAQL